ncbi:MAG: SdrD B-like domain-containing protein, partial [bacterium]
RLFPNPENPDRLNENINWDATYDFSSLNSLRLEYSLQNELGRIAESRSHSSGATFYQTLEWVKRINTYFGYRRQESKSFSSHSYDFINDKLTAGLRFSILGELYYYLNKEYNWLEERFSGDHSQPHAMETGLDWRGRVLFTPFDATMRLIYRDEEDTTSNLSFFSGEDYLEGYSELSYQPSEESELYCSTRIRNIWADNPNINKRIEADFRAGMRYFWDTGIRWESVGIVEGCIFKDYNSDGLRQRDEPPVEGIRVWLGKDRSKTTDIFGYYKFTKVKARKVFVNIDTSTVPSGYNLTVPATQEVVVSHGHEVEINFGIISRSEIIGTVFEDVNLNNQLDKEDLLIKGVVIALKDSTKVITDEFGRYSFRNISTGRHALSLDLNSIPPDYIPTVPIFHDLELFEGVSYTYNIPLKKVGKD